MSTKLSDCTSPWASVNWKHILHLTIQIDNKCDNVPLATRRFQSIKLFPITSSANCYIFETNHPTQFMTVLRKELHALQMFRIIACFDFETEWFGLLSLSFCYKLTSCGALWEAVLLLTTRAVDGEKSGDDYWGLRNGPADHRLKNYLYPWKQTSICENILKTTSTVLLKWNGETLMKWLSEQFWGCRLCVYVLIETSHALQCVCVW